VKVLLAVEDALFSSQVIEVVLTRQWFPKTHFKILTVEESGNANARDHLLKTVFKDKRLLEEKFPHCIVSVEIRHGNPAKEIVEAARAWKADELVLGTHGSSTDDRRNWGEVSESVAMKAPCRVAVVR